MSVNGSVFLKYFLIKFLLKPAVSRKFIIFVIFFNVSQFKTFLILFNIILILYRFIINFKYSIFFCEIYILIISVSEF